MEVCVLGAGSWGTALTLILAKKGYDVRLWARREELANQIKSDAQNKRYLPGIFLPSNVTVSSKIEESIHGADAIVLALPSTALRGILSDISDYIDPSVLLIHAGKGLENVTGLRGSQVIGDVLGEKSGVDVVALSGPNLAFELANEVPTATVAASRNIVRAKLTQDLFMSPALRVYTNFDIIGVELGGSLKNIIGIGAGIAQGLGYGDNTKATLATRGLMEMVRLGDFLGADPQTFNGLSGIGDVIATCASSLSRNNRLGQMLGRGILLKDALSELGQVAEGVYTCQAAYNLSIENKIYMPITHEIYAILFQNKSAKQAVNDLMSRAGKDELH